MDRQFPAFGGFGYHPFFRPFFNPFFPRRYLFPYFSISPFAFPFYRDGSGPNELCFAQHQAHEGETLENVAHAYNIPHTILEEANPHLVNPNQLRVDEVVYIPRISNLHCQKTYMERDMPETGMTKPMHHGQQTMPYTGSNY
ncbi:LysM domain-containing protein [Paenibacillus psychroresistens]|uniref:LysM domain-containing protein n=1 Tax=Paenibacillus psychroresistens TaxID=1778678 RepID=A0A6B8RR20_9BACL|nr:LysM domain-containing protein [Paenibacillus psychroresistens]QGQ97836.1 LysM domain-containing protein [Paenibacillus psychroresistens]